MKVLLIEMKKQKRAGAVSSMLLMGVLGALYGLVNFMVRKESLLSLPMEPMDTLLTQLYGMIMVLNLFGIVVASCIMYNMEFKGGAVKKMYTLPVGVGSIYSSKFLILSASLFTAVILQNLALLYIGVSKFPEGSFELPTLLCFTGYSFLTAMPVLSFMLLVSSRCENMWVSLGIGVAGFLSAMAIANAKSYILLIHPFMLMLKPAVAMSARPDMGVVLAALGETVVFLAAGVCMAECKRYE